MEDDYGPAPLDIPDDEWGLDITADTPVPRRKAGHASGTAPDPLYLAARRRRVAKLRMEGRTNVEIAQIVGVHPQTVANDVKVIIADYAGIATRDWEDLVEEEVFKVSVDEQHLRAIMAMEEDTDRMLRIYDRVLSTGKEKRDILALKEASKAARGVVDKQAISINLQWDGQGEIVDADVVEEIVIDEPDLLENGGDEVTPEE